MSLRAGFHGTVGQPTAQVIDGSLQFDSSYLKRTPGGSGNTNIWTFSCWIKRSSITATHYIFRTPSTDEGFYISASDDKIDVYRYSGSFTYLAKTQQVLRDVVGWYNIVYVHNSTAAGGSRLKIYINGIQQDLTITTDISFNTGYSFNTAVEHRLGEINGQMSQAYFIDGYAIGPEQFGFTDPLTNTWRPKAYITNLDTKINAGIVWSDSWDGSGSTGTVDNPARAFNGDLTNYTSNRNSNTICNWVPSTPIPVKRSLRVYAGAISSGNNQVFVNGTSLGNIPSGPQWYSIQATELTSVGLQDIGSTHGYLYAVEVDGVILVDSSTSNSTDATYPFGTNGFYLPMDNEDDFEKDKSGNGNDFTKNSFSGTSVDPDVVKDSPSGAVFGGRAQTGITTTSSAPASYPTLSPLTKGSRITLSNNSLDLASSASSGNADTMEAYATFTASSGKFYAEVTNSSNRTVSVSSGTYSGPSASIYSGGGQNSLGGTASGSVPSFTTSDFLAVAIDYDDKNVYFYKNNTLVYSVIGYTTELDLFFADRVNSSGSSGTSKWNFGQRPFRYAPPQGFLALNSASARPNTVVPRPKDYVGVATYDGSGSSFQEMNVGFKPDFVWCKSITNAENHALFDSVRGSTKFLRSDSPDNQYTISDVNFTLKGFSFANSSGEINESGQSYVGLAWRAGGAPTADNTQTSGAMTANSVSVDGVLQSAYTPSGSPSTYPKRMSVGTDQGFSIVQFVGNASNRTLPHGLGKPAKFMIVKNMDTDSTGWGVYHDAIGTATDNYIELQATTAADTDDTAFQDTAPTSDVFSIGTKAAVNNDTDDTIAYIWADVPGMQKFGKFAGNNSSDGVYVELGFKPAILLLKNYDNTGDWIIWDNERNKFNPVNRQIWPYTTSGTYGDYDQVGSNYPLDFLSNGFKIRTDDADMNSSSRNYFYAAWAEQPASNLFGGQSNAR